MTSLSLSSQKIPFFYKKLLHSFGSQGWWPTGASSNHPGRYRPGKSPGGETEKEKIEISLGAILTQNTAWTNASAALQNLAKYQFLSYRGLEKISPLKMEGLIRSSGYFRQKTKTIKNWLRALRPFNGQVGRWIDGSFLEARNRVLSVSGIGPETADSILLYAGGRPVFVVDAYTKRIGERWGVLKKALSYDQVQRIFQESLKPSADLYGEFHALLVELAKRHCYKRKPDCGGCPVSTECRHGSKKVKRIQYG